MGRTERMDEQGLQYKRTDRPPGEHSSVRQTRRPQTNGETLKTTRRIDELGMLPQRQNDGRHSHHVSLSNQPHPRHHKTAGNSPRVRPTSQLEEIHSTSQRRSSVLRPHLVVQYGSRSLVLFFQNMYPSLIN